MKSRGEALDMLQKAVAMSETQFKYEIDCVIHDREKSLTEGIAAKQYLALKGIVNRFTTSYVSTDGLSKLNNVMRRLLDGARTFIFEPGVPLGGWFLAVHHFCRVRLYLPHRALTPCNSSYHRLTGKPPNVSRLRQFGAQVEVTNSTHNTGLNKFEERSQNGILVGYTDDSLMLAKVLRKGSGGSLANPSLLKPLRSG
jgi:hypothetical protein